MKYERFEDLPVWKDAVELAVQIFALMEDEAFKGKGSLRDQIERAAVSISNNIAEGFERGTTQELITFIYIARGSAGEVRSMFHLFSRLPNSDIEGQRYLNETTRKDYERQKGREEAMAEWRQMREDLTAWLEAEQRQRETERKQSGEQT
jgi:four helix bundle protein